MTLKLLAVDTATENCSVALCMGDEVIARCESVPREHTTRILPLVDSLLAEAGLSLHQLDGLAFGRGPGSFTGVRIGIGIAQGLAFGADLPLLGISTLAAMAEQVYRKEQGTQVISAIDARMNEIYIGGYSRQPNGDWNGFIDETVISPERFMMPDGISHLLHTAGTGWEAYPDLINRLSHTPMSCKLKQTKVLYPEAQDMLVLAKHAYLRGEQLAPENASPVYLRDTVTWKKLPGRE